MRKTGSHFFAALSGRRAHWRAMRLEDLPRVSSVAELVHPNLPERPEVFEEKFRLFPAGCFALEANRALVGYAISHPWRLHDIPPLDAFLGTPPASPDCLYLHDVAVLPAARGHGAAAGLLERLREVARGQGVHAIALTSVSDTERFWNRLGFEAVSKGRLEEKLDCYGAGACYMVGRV